MALIEKLEAIGDAIRSKTGGTEELTLDEMVDEIEGISGGGGYVEPGDWHVEDFDTVDKDTEILNSVTWIAPKNVNSISFKELDDHWTSSDVYRVSNTAYSNMTESVRYRGQSQSLRDRLLAYDSPSYSHFCSRWISIITIPKNIKTIYQSLDGRGSTESFSQVYCATKPFLYFEDEDEEPVINNDRTNYGGVAWYGSSIPRKDQSVNFICKSRKQYDNFLYKYRNTNEIVWQNRHSLTAMNVINNNYQLAIGTTSVQDIISELQIIYNGPYLDFDNSTINFTISKISGVNLGEEGTGTYKLVDTISGVESNIFNLEFLQPSENKFIKVGVNTSKLLELGQPTNTNTSTQNIVNNVDTSASVDGHTVYTIQGESAGYVYHLLLKIKTEGYDKNSIKMYYKAIKSSSYGSVSDFQTNTPSYANWTNPSSVNNAVAMSVSTGYDYIEIPIEKSIFEEKTQYIDLGFEYYSWSTKGFSFYFDDDIIWEGVV